MKQIFLILFFYIFVQGFSQGDTLNVSAREMVDSIFYNFSHDNCNTGKLLNRIVNRKDSSLTWLYKMGSPLMDTITADHMYNLISENNFISFDSSNVYNPRNYFQNTFNHILDYGEDRNLVPLGIVDFNYNYFNFDSLLNLGVINVDDVMIEFDDFEQIGISQSRVSIVGPVFDFVSGEIIEFVLLEELIITDDASGVKSIEVNFGEEWQKYNVGDTIKTLAPSSDLFYFDIKVVFNSRRTIFNTAVLRTPENTELHQSRAAEFSCDEEGVIEGVNGRKLKWCLLHGCVPNGENSNWDKPFVLVSGYRPPAVALSWKNFYKLFNTWQNDYLTQLQQNGYDVFLVKFNFDYKPYIMGTEDASNLFIEFIDMLNARKTQDSGGYHENALQGNSMGADVIRLALNKIENAHYSNGRPHHHSRLFVSTDANYYGANIPLSHQYLAKSKFFHTPITGFLSWPFYLWINTIIEAKLFRELVLYHSRPNGNPDVLSSSHIEHYSVPQDHWERTILNNALENNYQGSMIVPIPDHTRNIGVSVGKLKETNSIEFVTNLFDNHHLDFVSDGNPFANVNFLTEQYYVRASVTGNYYQDLFRRKSFFGWFGVPFVFMNQKVKVKDMLAIDNSAGSYMRGFANLGHVLAIFNVVEFVLSFDIIEVVLAAQLDATKFTHKPTVSALAINPNLWPSNGSMTLNMQNLNLMYQEFNYNPNEPSQHFGYPHLGNPTNHFDITPFEAIYVDNQVHPHIVLEDSYDPFVDSLNNFLLNEIEPWYLGLQNLELGSQVQPSVIYKAKRRAKYTIAVGENVTPITNISPYIVKSNADLILNAGNDITFKPGFHVQQGGKVHAKIHYIDCSQNLLMPESTNDPRSILKNGYYEDVGPEMNHHLEENENKLSWGFDIFPNPTNKSYFYLSVLSSNEASELKIYNSFGVLVKHQKGSFSRSTKIIINLDPGVYYIEVKLNEEIQVKKMIVT